MENFYCIAGIVEASKPFATDEKATQELESDLRKNHIPETLSLVSKETLIALLQTRIASHCVMRVFHVMVAEYKRLGYQYSENCLRCDRISCHDGLYGQLTQEAEGIIQLFVFLSEHKLFKNKKIIILIMPHL